MCFHFHLSVSVIQLICVSVSVSETTLETPPYPYATQTHPCLHMYLPIRPSITLHEVSFRHGRMAFSCVSFIDCSGVVSAYYLWSTTLTEGNAHVQHILPLCSEHQAYLFLPLVVLSGEKRLSHEKKIDKMTFPYHIVSKRKSGNSACVLERYGNKKKKKAHSYPSNVRKRYFGWSKCAVFVIREATKDKGNLPSLSSRVGFSSFPPPPLLLFPSSSPTCVSPTFSGW